MLISFTTEPTHVNSVPNINIDGADIERVTQAKVLGVTVSPNLSWNAHVDNIVTKANKRVDMPYQLKTAGIRQSDIVKIYLSVIRTLLEYACPVWHTGLLNYLSYSIEIVQKRALKCIYPGLSYNDIWNITKLPTLVQRRDSLCREYFQKIQKESHRLNHLLPNVKNVVYD